MKSLRRLLCLLSLCLGLFAPVKSDGQIATPIKDAHAVQLIETAIQAMGGQTAWAQVYKVHTEWSMTEPNDPQYSGSQKWDDDWSVGFLAFSHTLNDGYGEHVFSGDASHNVKSQDSSGVKVLPRKLQDIARPLYLPAASLQISLRDPQSRIEYLGLADDSSSIAWLNIVKIDSHGYKDPFTREKWSIDLNTGYPVEVDYYTEDLLSSKARPQTISFSAYKQVNGLSVPSLLKCNMANDPAILQLSSLTF